jgi:predicted RNA-binding Zn-ribbon protein involved in translation (DUF1610 family)
VGASLFSYCVLTAFVPRGSVVVAMSTSAITAILPALNQAVKTVTGVVGLIKDVETKQKVIELQSAILDLHERVRSAQTEQDELLKSKNELERKLAEYERWDKESACYELRALVDGIFVYALKAENKGNGPEHFLCPNCFGERKLSIVHHPRAGYSNYICDACKFDVNPVRQTFPKVSMNQRDRFRGLPG